MAVIILLCKDSFTKTNSYFRSFLSMEALEVVLDYKINEFAFGSH